jgi:hypothetical protein
MSPRRVAIALSLVALCAARGASASGSERAAQIFRQGQDAFAHKNYAAAAAAFEQAAELAPHPAAWLDAAEAWELDGALARAAQDVDRALALPDVSEGHRHEAEARLARLLPKVATLDLHTTLPQLVRLDGAGELRAPGKHRVAPGHHTVALELATSTAPPVAVDARAGETTRIDLDPPAPAAPPPSSAAPPASKPDVAPSPAVSHGSQGSHGPPVASWVAFGGAALAAGVGVTFGAMTLSARTDYTNAPTPDSRDRFYRLRTTTNIAWGVAGIAAATGVVLWWTTSRDASANASGVGLAVGDGAVFLSHQARF